MWVATDVTAGGEVRGEIERAIGRDATRDPFAEPRTAPRMGHSAAVGEKLLISSINSFGSGHAWPALPGGSWAIPLLETRFPPVVWQGNGEGGSRQACPGTGGVASVRLHGKAVASACRDGREPIAT